MVLKKSNLITARECVHIFVKKVISLNNINCVKYFNYKTTSNAANVSDFNNSNTLKPLQFKNYHTHSYNNASDSDKLINQFNHIKINDNLFVSEPNYNLINSCKDAYELVRVVNKLGKFTNDELELIAIKATQIISNDMKANSILLLTLTQLRIDTRPFIEKLSKIQITNNEHMILRSLSESNINPEFYTCVLTERINKIYDNYFKEFENNNSFVDAKRDHFDGDHKLKCIEKYNYICSYCKFIYKRVVRDISHINVIESYIDRCNLSNVNELDYYTIQQLVDICYHLALVNSERCIIVMDKLHDIDFYKKVHYSELIQMFTKAASFDENNRFENVERLILEMYKTDGFKLELEECVNLLIAVGRSRKCGVILIDRVVEDIKHYTNELEFGHVTKILINLSKLNYNNRGFVRYLANMMLSFIDDDSILDPFTISNTIKSFGRFNYYNEKLMKILMSIMEKEEVLAEFQLHDLVTIFTSISKILSSKAVNYTKLNINRYMRMLANKISTSDINTETAMKLINASGRILYNCERFLNTLIESINLNEVDDLSKLCKLKINCDKLSLFYPELTTRIREIQRTLRPVADEAIETDKQPEGKSISDESDTEDSERTIYVRRNIIQRDLKLPSVRKRKWTY